jgi:prevent-host-death family protein
VNDIRMDVLVDIAEAGTRLPQLIDQAVAGAEVVITRDGHPVAGLVPVDEPIRSSST